MLKITLASCDTLVLENPDYDTAVLSLPLGRSVGGYLSTGAHGPRSQHVGQGNATLLLEKIHDIERPLLAQLLIQGGRTNC